MTTEAAITALTAECNGKDAEIARLRAENERMRSGIHLARHHLAMALRALNLDATLPTTPDHNSG